MDEEGTIQLKGRLRRSGWNPPARHRVLLSLKHLLVIMMSRQAFEATYHKSNEYVRSILQLELWIMCLRNALRSIKHQCVNCTKVAAQLIQLEMVDPEERVYGFSQPFQNSGIKSFGPFKVQFPRRIMKNRCSLFTCLPTRTVQIEVVDGLNSDACLMALSSSKARRGRSHTFVSDNDTKSFGAAREFQKISIEWNKTLIF